jgi:AhpC/TSA family
MGDLAKHYGALSVLGVEVVAVQPRSSPNAIAELGQTPPVLFPVVTEGNENITAAFRMFARGATHAELLIDRQGYIRAIWRGDQTGDTPGRGRKSFKRRWRSSTRKKLQRRRLMTTSIEEIGGS